MWTIEDELLKGVVKPHHEEEYDNYNGDDPHLFYDKIIDKRLAQLSFLSDRAIKNHLPELLTIKINLRDYNCDKDEDVFALDIFFTDESLSRPFNFGVFAHNNRDIVRSKILLQRRGVDLEMLFDTSIDKKKRDRIVDVVGRWLKLTCADGGLKSCFKTAAADKPLFVERLESRFFINHNIKFHQLSIVDNGFFKMEFNNCNFTDVIFNNVIFNKVVFIDCQFKNVCFVNCRVIESRFSKCRGNGVTIDNSEIYDLSIDKSIINDYKISGTLTNEMYLNTCYADNFVLSGVLKPVEIDDYVKLGVL